MVLDELDFVRRHSERDQLGLDVLIDRQPAAFRLRSREVAEHHLGQPLLARRLPDAVDFPDGEIRLGLGMIRRSRTHEPQVERRLAALPGDLEHVVLLRIDEAGLQFLRPLGQGLDESLQLGRRGRPDNLRFATLQLRHREFEHVRGLDIRGLPEQVHQLRHIHESREAGVEPVAGAVRGQLHRRHRFAERPAPGVEMLQVLPAQHLHL
jgi:hypothetical protein